MTEVCQEGRNALSRLRKFRTFLTRLETARLFRLASGDQAICEKQPGLIDLNPLSIHLAIPEELVAAFASSPPSQFNEIAFLSTDESWPFYDELKRFLRDLPREAIELTYSDEKFLGLHGRDERRARIWFTERLFTDEVCRRRLKELAEPGPKILPYTHPALSNLNVDKEGLVPLSSFDFDGSCLTVNGFSFVACLVNQSFNSTYWLQRSWFAQHLSEYISVRLDPFLLGRADSFPRSFFKMLVYGVPLDWGEIGRLRKPNHGRWNSELSLASSELTEFCWDPREDGIHFVCEELPPRDRTAVQAARYLHAIYDPARGKITHFDGALRIYSEKQIEGRLERHVRDSGKAGVRTKIFRIDREIDREAFSPIAQAFFIWNEDVTEYFRSGTSRG